jgi:hypothetical protein
MKPDRKAAVIIIDSDGYAAMRPALFVYPTPDGFAWVEPAYREPVQSRPAFYRVAGVMAMTAGSFSCQAPDGRSYFVSALEDLDGPGEDLRAACAWAEADIRDAGDTMDGERERLRTLLADELA